MKHLLTLRAVLAPQRAQPSNYPALIASRLLGRAKQLLGELFGLANFGVNLTRLPPGAMSSLRHAHTRQDEFIFILEGTPTLVTDRGETPLEPGMCAGFRAGTGDAHHLINRAAVDALFLEIGDRDKDDRATYPDDDLQAVLDTAGKWVFSHKDGSPY